MKFSVFVPQQAEQGPVPVLTYLAGLTCTEATFMIKAGAQGLAAELGLRLVAPDATKEVASRYGIGHVTTDLGEALAQPGVEAAILCTPTQIHAAQAIQCLQAGKHVQVEIPLADSLKDAEAVDKVQKETGLVAMVGHTRRFNPSHQYVHNRIVAGELKIHQMDVQTYFFRRTNMNALGQPRSWTDHLLWHHAAHTVDLFQYQTGEAVVAAHALQDREFFSAIKEGREPNASVAKVLPCYRTLHDLDRSLAKNA